MQITAYKCTQTGKLFEDAAEYRRHTRRLKTAATSAAKRAAEVEAAIKQLVDLRQQVKGIEEIPDWIMLNHEQLTQIERIINNTHHSKKPYIKPYLVTVTGHWSILVPNTHCCPKNGVTNWRQIKDLPLGYPGFYGNITWGANGETGLYHILKVARLHLGTGGANACGDGYYGFQLFLEDWPNISGTVVAAKLAGKNYTSFSASARAQDFIA